MFRGLLNTIQFVIKVILIICGIMLGIIIILIFVLFPFIPLIMATLGAIITTVLALTMVISGDIAESHDVAGHIEDIETAVRAPVYFVLGNHDFYGSSVKKVKASVKHLSHLDQIPLISLSETTALVGVDAFSGDCRNGNYDNSRLTMSDWLHIDDLRGPYGRGKQELKKALQKLADGYARKLKRRVLRAISEGFKRIIIVTHAPPFENACLYAGKKSTPDGLCFFSSQCLGTTIEPIAKQFPNIDFLWLCGHTHSKVTLNVLKNLQVRVAGAEYFYPTVVEEIKYE
jgi:predicted phosphohydrolase